MPSGDKGPEDHRTKLRLKAFKKDGDDGGS